MNSFGDVIPDEPGVAASHAPTIEKQGGECSWTNLAKIPPKDTIMILHATYQPKDKNIFHSKVAIYYERVYDKYWWTFLKKEGTPVTEYRNGPFDFPHQAITHVLAVFNTPRENLERIA